MSPKLKCFCSKNVSFRQRTELTDATEAFHTQEFLDGAPISGGFGGLGGSPNGLAIFVIFRQIIAVLALFRSHFADFSELYNGIKFLKFESLLKEINSPTPLASLLAGQIQNKFERLHLGVKWLWLRGLKPILLLCRQRGRMGKGVVFTQATTRESCQPLICVVSFLV